MQRRPVQLYACIISAVKSPSDCRKAVRPVLWQMILCRIQLAGYLRWPLSMPIDKLCPNLSHVQLPQCRHVPRMSQKVEIKPSMSCKAREEPRHGHCTDLGNKESRTSPTSCLTKLTACSSWSGQAFVKCERRQLCGASVSLFAKMFAGNQGVVPREMLALLQSLLRASLDVQGVVAGSHVAGSLLLSCYTQA